MTALVFNMRKIQNSYLFFIFYKKNLFDNLKCNLPNLVNSVENVDTMDNGFNILNPCNLCCKNV